MGIIIIKMWINETHCVTPPRLPVRPKTLVTRAIRISLVSSTPTAPSWAFSSAFPFAYCAKNALQNIENGSEKDEGQWFGFSKSILWEGVLIQGLETMTHGIWWIRVCWLRSHRCNEACRQSNMMIDILNEDDDSYCLGHWHISKYALHNRQLNALGLYHTIHISNTPTSTLLSIIVCLHTFHSVDFHAGHPIYCI